MALAFLYARALESHKFLPNAHGFIVDHKARPESTEEADWVAEQLRSKCKLHARMHSSYKSLICHDSRHERVGTHRRLA